LTVLIIHVNKLTPNTYQR